jgi:hypothetical protein
MNYNLESGFGRRSVRVPHRGLMIGFVIAWGLLTILVVLQDRAIDAQRDLIHSLLQDLHSALVTSVSQANASSVPVVVKEMQLPSHQVQSKSAPSVQVPSHSSSKVQPHAKGSRTASSQGKDAGAHPDTGSRKAAEPLPVRPPAQYTDPSDRRRVTYSI